MFQYLAVKRLIMPLMLISVMYNISLKHIDNKYTIYNSLMNLQSDVDDGSFRHYARSLKLQMWNNKNMFLKYYNINQVNGHKGIFAPFHWPVIHENKINVQFFIELCYMLFSTLPVPIKWKVGRMRGVVIWHWIQTKCRRIKRNVRAYGYHWPRAEIKKSPMLNFTVQVSKMAVTGALFALILIYVIPLFTLQIGELSIAPSIGAGAVTYYVDRTLGNDGNAGTAPGAGNAWLTVNKINISSFNDEDEILFKDDEDWSGDNVGLLTDQGGSTGALRITYSNYGAGSVRPQLDFIQIWTSNLIFDGLMVDGNTHSGATSIQDSNPGVPHDNITFLNMVGTHSSPYSNADSFMIFTKGGTNWLIQDTTATDYTNRSYGFYGTAANTFNTIMIDTCTGTHSSGSGSGNGGFNLHETAGNDMGANLTIKNSTSSGWDEEGFDVTSGNIIKLYGLECFDNIEDGVLFAHTSYDIWMWNCHFHDERKAIVVFNRNIKIWTTLVVGDGVNTQELFKIDDQSDEYADNLFVEYCVLLWGGAGDIIEIADTNNTVGSLTFRNNKIGSTGATLPNVVSLVDATYVASDSDFTFAYNRIQDPAGACSFNDNGTSRTLAQFEAQNVNHTGSTEGSLTMIDRTGATSGFPDDAYPSTGDGLATPITTGSYFLVDGTASTGIDDDRDGNLKDGSSPDNGFVEYQSTGTTNKWIIIG